MITKVLEIDAFILKWTNVKRWLNGGWMILYLSNGKYGVSDFEALHVFNIPLLVLIWFALSFVLSNNAKITCCCFWHLQHSVFYHIHLRMQLSRNSAGSIWSRQYLFPTLSWPLLKIVTEQQQQSREMIWFCLRCPCFYSVDLYLSLNCGCLLLYN